VKEANEKQKRSKLSTFREISRKIQVKDTKYFSVLLTTYDDRDFALMLSRHRNLMAGGLGPKRSKSQVHDCYIKTKHINRLLASLTESN
jgi:hypothetical protein